MQITNFDVLITAVVMLDMAPNGYSINSVNMPMEVYY